MSGKRKPAAPAKAAKTAKAPEPASEIGKPSFLFAVRVIRSSVLQGFEVMAFWEGDDGEVVIRARHPYGAWRGVRVQHATSRWAESENGSPVTASDVAMRLRRNLADKPQLHFRFRERT